MLKKNALSLTTSMTTDILKMHACQLTISNFYFYPRMTEKAVKTSCLEEII
jgi:hypothetical protein